MRRLLAAPGGYALDGCIVFFGDVHAPPWHVDGMLTHFRNAGKLERAAGVVIGEMFESDPTKDQNPWLRSRSMEDVFEQHLKPLGVPIVFNLPLGHGENLWTLPLGVTATIDADTRIVTLDESALEPQPARV